MYGGKLKSVASEFPGDVDVTRCNRNPKIGDSPVSLEDSLAWYSPPFSGKRRNKLVDDTDVTWYRWDDGWVMIAEYAGQAGSWTVGTREMSYTLNGMLALADVPGANPSTGTYRYYAQDHLGSLRAVNRQNYWRDASENR